LTEVVAVMKRVEHWGVIGWSDEFGALADESTGDTPVVEGYGFERILDPGVIYRPQPDIPGIPKWVEKPGSKSRIFQMGWPDPEPPVTRSLLDLHASISIRRQELTADDKQLASLDEAIGGLVDIASRLHATHATLGFIQPDSVRIATRHDGSTLTLLPDVGFAWDDTGGLYEPEWLASPTAELLFDSGARPRNSEYVARLKRLGEEQDLRSRAKGSAGEEVEDVKIVARLIAMALVGKDEVGKWCGAAKSLLRLPGRDIAPDTGAPIWDQVVAPALDGRIQTFEELQLKLLATKPSEHFLFTPPPPPWKGWAALRQVGLAATAVGLLCGLWQLKDVLFPPRVQSPFCKQVPETDPLHQKLFDLQQLHDKARVDQAVRADFWQVLRDCRKAHAALPQCRNDCLREPVEDYLQMTMSDGEEVLARLRARPRPVAVERVEIAAALTAIREAAAEAKRDPASAVEKRLERQQTLRDGKATAKAAEPRPTAEKVP
jgi:hypothetical protein